MKQRTVGIACLEDEHIPHIIETLEKLNCSKIRNVPRVYQSLYNITALHFTKDSYDGLDQEHYLLEQISKGCDGMIFQISIKNRSNWEKFIDMFV